MNRKPIDMCLMSSFAFVLSTDDDHVLILTSILWMNKLLTPSEPHGVPQRRRGFEADLDHDLILHEQVSAHFVRHSTQSKLNTTTR